MNPSHRSPVLFFVVVTLLTLATALLSLLWGQMGLFSWHELLGAFTAPWNEPDPTLLPVQAVLWEIRMPRLILALIVGANLAVAGVLLQSLFHNPMADPYVMGVSSGAGFGATLAFACGWESGWLGLQLTSWSAFAGAVLTGLLVYTLARRRGLVTIAALLLTGIALGGLLQSLTTLVILQSDILQSRSILSWLMGSLAYRGWEYPLALLPQSCLALAAAWSLHRALNLLATGEESAYWLGLRVERIKLIILALAALLAASAVAAAGIIGFVGLLVPHIVRLCTGANHSVLLPASILTGGWVVLASDLLARNLVPGQELPIGIVTGVLGCLFFLHLLRHHRGRIG